MPEKHRYKTRFEWSALLVVILVAGCSSPRAGPIQAVRIGFTPAVDYLPYFVMRDRGIDRKERLQLVPTTYSGGAAVIAAMASGSVDAGYVGSIPLLDAAANGLLGSAVTVVAANTFSDRSHLGAAVLVSPSVQGWKDLEGSFIAINTPTSLGGWAIVGRLKQEGVRKYTFVNISFENMGLAVAGGSVRAAVMFEPYVTQSLQRGDGKLLGWIIGGPPLDSIPLSTLTLRTGFIKDNPAAARALIRAHIQAVRWLLKNETEARVILGRGLSITPQVTAEMILLQWRSDCRNDPALWESTQRTLASMGFLKRILPAASLYDEALLAEVLESMK